MFTRRTATVTISAPEAAWACAMMACDGYLPVPTINRDVNVRPAMTNGVSVNRLPSTDEVDDLHRIALANQDVGKRWALDDVQVVFHGDASWIDVELREQRRHRLRTVELEPFAVECDRHCNETRLEGLEHTRKTACSSAYCSLFEQVKAAGLDAP